MNDVDRHLADLVTAAGQVLGDAHDGAYVAGSIALDAHLPGRSDVDVALTCTRPLALAAGARWTRTPHGRSSGG